MGIPASDLQLQQSSASNRVAGFFGVPSTPHAAAMIVVGALAFLIFFRTGFRALVIE